MDTNVITEATAPDRPVSPTAVNHMVFNVRDIEESHQFWTEIIGFKHVGTAKPRPDRPVAPKMRFYSCDHGGGRLSHHDLALLENPDLPAPPADWSMVGMRCAVNHIALAYPDRDSWLRQLAFLQSKGIKFDLRVEHGMTHSLYIHDPNGYGIELLYELGERHRRCAELFDTAANRRPAGACGPTERIADLRRLRRAGDQGPAEQRLSTTWAGQAPVRPGN